MNPNAAPVVTDSSHVVALPLPQSQYPTATLIIIIFGLVLLLVIAPLLARVICRLCRLEKPNFRQEIVPASVGIGFVVVAIVVYGALALTSAPLAASAPIFLLTAGGFGFLGLFDDLYGSRAVGGFRGHLKSLLSGRLTTGVFKLLGGGFVALAASYFVNGASLASPSGPHWTLGSSLNVIVDAAIIALSANALNLLDVRPGRAQFGFILLCLPTLWAVLHQGLGWIQLQPPPAVLLGPVALAALVEWWPDSAGRAMMGDTGSNLLGAVAALAAVTVLPLWGRIGLLLLVLALNVTAERVSLSLLIARTPLLKRIDSWLGAR